jgi:hypothetical protein
MAHCLVGTPPLSSHRLGPFIHIYHPTFVSHVANFLPQQLYSKVTGHGAVVPQITQGVDRVSRE